MYLFELSIASPISYNFTGKFESPSPNWMHEDFPLTDYELFVITKGVLYLAYAGENFTVSSGEFLLLPPSAPPLNRRYGIRPSECSFYWMHFETAAPVCKKVIHEKSLSTYSSSLTKDTIFIPGQEHTPNQEKIIVLMKQLQDAVKNSYKPVVLNYMCTTILCELYSQFYIKDQTLNRSRKTQKQIYHDIIDYVKQNVNENLKVSDVANYFGYNNKYLSNLFRTIAGIPLKQFILTSKVDAANFMLTDTNKSITEIAHALGYPDSHNFSRTYKKIAGLSPSRVSKRICAEAFVSCIDVISRMKK